MIIIYFKFQHQYRDFSVPKIIPPSNHTEFRMSSSSKAILPKAIIRQQIDSEEDDEVSDVFLDQEPKVKEEPKLIKDPIRTTSLSPVEYITLPSQGKSFVLVIKFKKGLSSYVEDSILLFIRNDRYCFNSFHRIDKL